jgi:hypothetical protein
MHPGPDGTTRKARHMATTKTNRQYPQTDAIVIERRETIATIHAGFGTVSMITAAFTAIGEYLSDHDDTPSVEFVAFGTRFAVTTEPIGLGPVEATE